MKAPRVLLRLSGHALNGIGVALGIALIQLLVGGAGGMAAGLIASSGAVLASLADTPNVPSRTWRRVLTAALVGSAASAVVMLLRPDPLLLGVATVVLGFLSCMTLIWGPRAGALSFVPILALVFTMAVPPIEGTGPLLEHLGFTALGTLLYVGWSVLTARLLRPRLSTLALAGALQATADLLRSRATLLAADPGDAGAVPPLQDWISRQVLLDERVQVARDMLFESADTPANRRHINMLLLAIDMRDTLLASELDLDLLGQDAPARQLLGALAAGIGAMADALNEMGGSLRLDQRLAGLPVPAIDLARLAESFDEGDSRRQLARVSQRRAQHMLDDLARLRLAAGGEDLPLALDRKELQLFVSPEGWPLAALKRHLTLASPVLRQSLRNALALGCAYFIAMALPWASHPHWLVLSVAVVLRGNLEQTLARRNARVAGTMLGCVLVLGLSLLDAPLVSKLGFLLAVGVAHAFVTRRYLVTATAATVMALVQAHLVHPAGGFGVGERLADTLLGALLAWGFSYVLPYWERRGLARLAARVLAGLRTLALESLRWPEPGVSDLPLRLARREVFDAMGSIAATAQRTGAEPERVRLPLFALATVLVQSHVLVAQLAAIRTLLRRRGAELDAQEAQAALRSVSAELERLLQIKGGPPLDELATLASNESLLSLPKNPDALMPWLQRRLALTQRAAARTARSARALCAYAGRAN